MPKSTDPVSDWDWPNRSHAAVGDSGPWVRWLPLAWQAAADPGTPAVFPDHAVRPRGETDPLRDPDLERNAYWAPLFQLTSFGLGWERPDIGLSKWLDAGRPREHPILRVVDDWWGDRVTEAIAWTQSPEQSGFEALLGGINSELCTDVPTGQLADSYSAQRNSLEWRQVWGGGSDPLHLGGHANTPIRSGDEATGDPELIVPDSASSIRAALMLGEYTGWYSQLHRLGSILPPRTDSRAWRVDVVVRPLGYLGTYRLSSASNRWFVGQHRWHQLGLASRR